MQAENNGTVRIATDFTIEAMALPTMIGQGGTDIDVKAAIGAGDAIEIRP